MSNDPNKPGGPAKTIMGWVSPNQLPKPGAAQPGAPAPQPEQPAPGAWGQQPPALQQPAPGAWGQQPPAPQQPAWNQQPPAPQQPAWGQQPPAPQQPAPGAWGQQPPQAQPPAPQQPAWGQQPPAPQQPAPGAWGQQPPQAQQPGPWGQQPPAPQQPAPGAWGQQPPQAQQPAWGQPGQAQTGQPQGFAPQGGAPGFGAGAGLGAAAGFGAAAAGFGGAAQPFGGAAQQPQGGAASSSGQPLSFGGPQGRGIAGADATVGVSDRVRFIRLTYLHLFGAIAAFTGLLFALFKVPFLAEKVSWPMIKFSLEGRWNWGIVLAAFMAVSWLADYWAKKATSRPLQYAGLAIYVVAEALIFVPLLFIVQVHTWEIVSEGGKDPNIIRDAAFLTLGIFGALTLSVFVSKKDFSFLRTALFIAGAAATGLVFLSIAFGFNLGIVFAIAMVVLAAGYILYFTSQVLAHYPPESYVAAALALFSSVALMFWYLIQILMRMRQ